MAWRNAVLAVCGIAGAALAIPPAIAANAKITPLGSYDGEFCPMDRAMIFEDPDGTRTLYDAGRTVAGPDDPRLGKIDAVLLSHVHGDHLGDRRIPKPNTGTCDKPDVSVETVPNSNMVDIVLAKKAKLLLGGEMPAFFANKIKALGGDPKLVETSRYGASKKVGGVAVASVPAVHANGLAVYLSSDTGIMADQDTVVRRYYKPKLAIINIGDVFTTGPTEAAYVINELVKPEAAIPSHANEVATKDRKVLPNTKTDIFAKAAKVPVHIPLSGRTMEFDENGKCTSGC